ncbi:MAG: glycoside hydrolase family 25 protein [Clostridia bacterium]|nr:glycoside hydrolase family 25 protein [Clostridia bacterium]
MAERVIDVSSHQKSVDFKKVKASGVTGVIIRAGYTGYGAKHKMYKDDLFETHYKGATEAGLNVGAYYYSCALTEVFAEKEAKYFLSLLEGKRFSLPVYMDVEEAHSTTDMPALGKARLTAVVKKWCETVENAGYFTGFYTMKSWCGWYLDMDALSRFTFWLAHWAEHTDYAGAYGMWQYSSEGRVPGIGGNVDLDYCYRDFPSIIRSEGLNGYGDKRYSVAVSGLTKAQSADAADLLRKAGFAPVVTEERGK